MSTVTDTLRRDIERLKNSGDETSLKKSANLSDVANAASARANIGAGTGNGTVTGVTASAPLASSGGAAPNITHSASGAIAGSYSVASITVDATGHVTHVIDATTQSNFWTGSQAFDQPPSAPSYAVSNIQVIGARDTGWGAATGLGIAKSAWSTYTTPGTISSTYSATVAGQLTTALAMVDTLSKRLAALQNALTAHGLIGP